MHDSAPTSRTNEGYLASMESALYICHNINHHQRKCVHKYWEMNAKHHNLV